jgi:hypothetical protein
MQQLPPPGWYADPWNAGRSWRWWDGAQWSVAEHAFHPEHRRQLREQARRAGRWMRIALVASAVLAVFVGGMTAAILSSIHGHLFTTNPDGTVKVSHQLRTLQIATILPGLASLAVTGIEIWWLTRIGEFANASGWPSTRNRTLGAWSLIIPIVNYWFPYQAIRDSNPPGYPTRVALRWWLWKLIGPPCAGIVVFVTAIAASGVVVAFALACQAAVLLVVAVFGFRLVDELDDTQDNALESITAV